MPTWYTAGVFAGFGLSLGVLLADVMAATRTGVLAALALGLAGGGLLGGFAYGSAEAVTGAFGGAAGAFAGAQFVRGTLRRGGTRAGTGIVFAIAAAGLAALALIPLLGYVEAVVVPGLAARLRRRAGRTYAGLRILARD
jgi:hypothetical protein